MVTQIFWLCAIWWKSPCVIIQKVTRQVFVVVLFKILFNVVLPFSSSAKILAFDFPNKSYKAVLLHGPNLLGKVLKQSFLHEKCVMQLPWKKNCSTKKHFNWVLLSSLHSTFLWYLLICSEHCSRTGIWSHLKQWSISSCIYTCFCLSLLE